MIDVSSFIGTRSSCLELLGYVSNSTIYATVSGKIAWSIRIICAKNYETVSKFVSYAYNTLASFFRTRCIFAILGSHTTQRCYINIQICVTNCLQEYTVIYRVVTKVSREFFHNTIGTFSKLFDWHGDTLQDLLRIVTLHICSEILQCAALEY